MLTTTDSLKTIKLVRNALFCVLGTSLAYLEVPRAMPDSTTPTGLSQSLRTAELGVSAPVGVRKGRALSLRHRNLSLCNCVHWRAQVRIVQQAIALLQKH